MALTWWVLPCLGAQPGGVPLPSLSCGLPMMGGCSPPPGPVPPSNPKASDSRLPQRKEGNVAACAVPGPLPEAVVILHPHRQLAGVLL